MKLFGAHLSPFFERAYIVLDAKGATDKVDLSMVPGGFGSPDHLALNPLGKIPYLQLDDGQVLVEGQAIAEFFDDYFPGDKLVPADPVAAARVRMLCRLVDLDLSLGYRPIAQALVFKNRDDEAIKNAIEKAIPRAFDAIEHFMDADGYMVDDRFSLADAALVPAYFQLKFMVAQFGTKDFGDRPKLGKWAATMDEHPLCQQSHARMQAILKRVMAA